MLQAIVDSATGDDVYKEDPTVNALEERIADMFGMDQALFFPSGSMANQAAIKLHTQPGEQLICHEYAHVYNYEGGGVSFNSGVSCKLLPGPDGMIDSASVKAAINPPDFYHSPLTSLVCLENTTNKGGGACYSLEQIDAIKQVTDEFELGLHLDGARLWNAMIATGQTAKDFGKRFDTISVCLSKGLGTPAGSVLIGSEKYMRNAIRVRKLLGGGMRQIGLLAGAGMYALDNNLKRLADDHKHARELATALAARDGVTLVNEVQTNIVLYRTTAGAGEALQNVYDELNVRVSEMGPGLFRIVTHLDYSVEHHRLLINRLR